MPSVPQTLRKLLNIRDVSSRQRRIVDSTSFIFDFSFLLKVSMACPRYLTPRAKFLSTATLLPHWVQTTRIACLIAHQEADGSFEKKQAPGFELYTEAKRLRNDGRYHSSKSTFGKGGGARSIMASGLLPIEQQSELYVLYCRRTSSLTRSPPG
jgi:hypothetical protein